MAGDKKYTIVPTKVFRNEFEKLSGVHQRIVSKKMAMLEQNPFYPSLRTKKMQGGSGNYESSVNMDIRLIWEFEGDKIIIMLDVGHHDVVNKY